MLWQIIVANIVMATVGDLFGPAVAALTLGLFAPSQLARRLSRNSAFDHAENVAIAVVARVIGWLFSPARRIPARAVVRGWRRHCVPVDPG
ncbi:MAG TPA: hypothetical protein VE690_12125 [Rhodopila sp.]|nr:hypothetical protein [Rhodopila sp.]